MPTNKTLLSRVDRLLGPVVDQLVRSYERHATAAERLVGFVVATIFGVFAGTAACLVASLRNGDSLVIGLIGLIVGAIIWLLVERNWRSHSSD